MHQKNAAKWHKIIKKFYIMTLEIKTSPFLFTLSIILIGLGVVGWSETPYVQQEDLMGFLPLKYEPDNIRLLSLISFFLYEKIHFPNR